MAPCLATAAPSQSSRRKPGILPDTPRCERWCETRSTADPAQSLPRRRTLTCQAHRILEALAEWRLAWQQRHLLNLHAANRAFSPIHLDVNGGAKLAPPFTSR